MTLTEVARETYRDKFNAAREKFLIEKKITTDQKQIETGLQASEIPSSHDQTIIENNAKENGASYKEDFGSEQNAITKDFARINENIEIQKSDYGHPIIMSNDSENGEIIETENYEDNFISEYKGTGPELIEEQIGAHTH